MTKNLIYILLSAMVLCLASCIEDGFSTSPSDQPTFSSDTIKMGEVFTGEQTATHRFVVFNRYDKGMNISDIRFSGENAGLFRLNVDGMTGTTFSNIEIRANDSIYVFVSADLPVNGSGELRTIDASLDFTVNGVTSSVVIAADGQDIKRLKGSVIKRDTFFNSDYPYQITDSLVVEEGATLTLMPGTRMFFHDGAVLIVRGTLKSSGTAEKPVRLTGDRRGNVITDVSFDLMSRQWYGVEFWSSSKGNSMSYTEISNTEAGVTVYGDGVVNFPRKLRLVNCRLRNSADCVLTAIGGSVEAYGCEFAESGYSLVYLLGGDHRFDHCTASNHYLFSAVSGAAWMFADPADNEVTAEMLPTAALVTNSITWGLGGDVYPGDLTGRDIYFKRCLFKAQGTDDDNFIDSLWDTDPLFYTVRSDYYFDYRVKPESPAINAAYPAYSDNMPPTDWYGVPRANDLGAYVYQAPEEQ